MSTKNKEIKEITDIDLDTGTNLVTENYQLEILGLKDLVDLRKFSRSFLKVDKLLKSIFTGKEDKIDKKSAFNKEFGVAQNEVLEGSKLAEILGIEYGGVLNNNNQKIAGKGYYDTANKKIYKCTTNTSINYADAGYFIEVSNNDLLGKLQNLASNIDTGLGYLRIFNYISMSGKVNLTNGTSTQVKYNHLTNGTIGVQLIASNPDCNYNKLTVVEESSLGFTIIHPNTYGTLAINYTAVCFL